MSEMESLVPVATKGASEPSAAPVHGRRGGARVWEVSGGLGSGSSDSEVQGGEEDRGGEGRRLGEGKAVSERRGGGEGRFRVPEVGE